MFYYHRLLKQRQGVFYIREDGSVEEIYGYLQVEIDSSLFKRIE